MSLESQMTSRKYEKATTHSSPSASFWKKSSISAIPGRPNPSSSSSPKAGVAARVTTTSVPGSSPISSLSCSSSANASTAAMPSSFRVFEASVSDAWAIQDEDMSSPQQQRPKRSNEAAHGSAVGINGSSSSSNNGVIPKSDNVSNAPGSSVTGSTKVEKQERFLASDSIELEALRKLSWSGLVPQARSKAWKILCGYLPGSLARQGEVLQRKQDEYNQYVVQYFHTKDQDIHQDTFRQIHIDIPRMSPVISLFQQKPVQEIFERILYIWAIRHPASGYVQGINDLVTPFFLVFLQDYIDGDLAEVEVAKALSEKDINAIEADSFWCLTKVLDGIQDNYTFAQPGIQLKVKQLEELVQRIDKELYDHLTGHEVLFLQFAFRWMNNILMREIPIRATIRLWDTYLSEIEGFSHFHLYVCAAFLLCWKQELMKKTDFHTLLMFLQNLPTAKWGDEEINLLVAEAFRLSYLFADAPSHLAQVAKKK